MIIGKPVSSSKVPLSRKCIYILSPNKKFLFFSLAKKELKYLDFKAQKGILTLVETECLAALRGVGCSTESTNYRCEPVDLVSG
jgi:hypothetical protein